MTQKIYQIDAFSNTIFSGNPAAVCPLTKWLSDEKMQNIAAENNLAETVFYVKHNKRYEIRWFTPAVEVDLCGHATLAAAFVLFFHEDYKENEIHFYSHRSGDLTVTKQGDFLTLNFPADQFSEIELTKELIQCFDQKPIAAFKGKSDYMVVFESETQILNLIPDLHQLAKLDARGIIVTARGNTIDFVSRFFGPKVGIDEDPVTGSAHTTLIPYWANIFGKTEFTAIQLSKRKGYLQCKHLNERVEISGQAKLYMQGEIYLE